MQQDKVDMYIMTNSKYLPQEKISVVRDRLLAMDDNLMAQVSSVEFKDPTTMLIISVFLGSLGVDRFMLGQVGLGILKLITLGGCGIWAIVDWFTIQRKSRERNFNALMMYL